MRDLKKNNSTQKWTNLKWVKLRIVGVSSGFVVFLLLILLRSYQLNIQENVRVDKLASRQYLTTLPVQPKRGTIFDRNGVVLAMDVQVDSIAVHPGQVVAPQMTAAKLASILKEPVSKILAKVQSNKKFEWVERRIDKTLGEQIKSLKLPGVSVAIEYRRFYPNRELAGQVLGAVGYEAVALGGLELALDSHLKTSPKKIVAEKDARGRMYTPITEQEGYNDVTLTIDSNLQFIAEKYLQENAQKYNVKSGFALVTNPKTGEILAMANYPSFNPNTYADHPQASWKNHAVVDTFEPGSTFKGILAAAALASGKVRTTDSFFCENGIYHIGKRVIHDHEAYGNLSFDEIIRFSSNIGVTKVAQKIGKEAFYNTIVDFGFGEKSGIEFPGEEKGRVKPGNKWADVEFSNIAFGQGVSVSGIQVAGAYATLANGGVRMKPYLVSKIATQDGTLVLENKPTALKKVMEEKAALSLTDVLKGVVEDKGTGKLAKLEGYPIAGKTGTAQKVNPKTRQYDPDNFVSSFIGYVPADKPQFMIYVLYDSPQPIHVGGVVAAPVFKNIAQEALAYSGIAPDNVQVAQKIELDRETKSRHEM